MTTTTEAPAADARLSYEQQAYELDDLWKLENISAPDRRRVEFLAGRVPAQARTLVDVGCGNGIFLNYLDETQPGRFDRLCGTDRSAAALRYVKTEKHLAGIDALPFGDGEFDLAACLEVLEHLPLDVYPRALAELARVARRWVLVTVPNDQDLARLLVTCPSCATRFNADYHMRSFRRPDMERLLDAHGFRCAEVFHIEKQPHYIGLRRLQRLSMPWYAICPVCGYHGDLVRPQGGEGAVRSLAKRLWPRYGKHRWIGGLYERAG